MSRSSTLVMLTLALFLSGVSVAYTAPTVAKLDDRLMRSAESFENVMHGKGGPIPSSIVHQAQGIVILREWGAGFGIGGKGGFGVAMERDFFGNWGPPGFLSIGEGSIGFQLGVQQLDMVFLLMNKESLQLFEKGKFRIGVDAAAAAGPVGVNAEAKAGSPILVYSANAGLYAGAAFEGGGMGPDNDANTVYYRKPGITLSEILKGEKGAGFPDAARPLREAINKAQ